MIKPIYQNADGNVENMIAGDMHVHYHKSELDELSEHQRYRMRTELLQYRGVFPEMHNLLCDYAYLAFGCSKFVDLEDKQLVKLYNYHSALLKVNQKRVKLNSSGNNRNAFKLVIRKIICTLEKWS